MKNFILLVFSLLSVAIFGQFHVFASSGTEKMKSNLEIEFDKLTEEERKKCDYAISCMTKLSLGKLTTFDSSLPRRRRRKRGRKKQVVTCPVNLKLSGEKCEKYISVIKKCTKGVTKCSDLALYEVVTPIAYKRECTSSIDTSCVFHVKVLMKCLSVNSNYKECVSIAKLSTEIYDLFPADNLELAQSQFEMCLPKSESEIAVCQMRTLTYISECSKLPQDDLLYCGDSLSGELSNVRRSEKSRNQARASEPQDLSGKSYKESFQKVNTK